MLDANIQSTEWLLQMTAILEALNEGVIIVDDQLRMVFANEALLRLGGYRRDEIYGRTPDAIFSQQDLPYIMQQHAATQRHGHNRNEFYLPRKNGEKVPVIYSSREIPGPRGQQYSLIVVTDISAQKSVEEQLRQSNALLERSNALLEQRQKQIQAELSLAARVQQSLTPRSLVWPASGEGDVAVEAYYSPASTIGGDFGVVLPHGDELSLLVCDVSGHGIGSALVANRIYSETLHELRRNTGLGSLLQHLHTFVCDYIGLDGFYFTMAAARFAARGRRLTFAAAGHPPAILLSNGSIRLLEAQSSILGSLRDLTASKSVHEVALTSGDRLILYTDGFIEIFNDRNEMLGVKGLSELVRRSAKRTLSETKQAILDGVAAWRHGPLTDDMSLVIVELR
jgi:sigma-B regulation protein RsbU (phosphoserine phosphatase)